MSVHVARLREATRMTTTETILTHHLDAFAEQDHEETMADYTEDSVVVTNLGTFRGLDEIAGMFEDFYAEFSQDGSELAVKRQTVEGDFAYIVWRGETPDNVYEFATDTFYIPDGTIEFQTFAGKVEPKG